MRCSGIGQLESREKAIAWPFGAAKKIPHNILNVSQHFANVYEGQKSRKKGPTGN